MYNPVTPDLIIEATSVCDRACVGCYAPNMISRTSAIELFQSNPSLFLLPERLATVLVALNLAGRNVAIRGGEPTRHPFLTELLQKISSYKVHLCLETHGKWLLSSADHKTLLSTLAATNTKVKLSFDPMHGTDPDELSVMIDALRRHTVQYSVAITESSYELFLKSLASIQRLAVSEIYFQQKAKSFENLVRPTIGVIGVDGVLKQTLTAKFGSWVPDPPRKLVAL